jgi:hypothetical protein
LIQLCFIHRFGVVSSQAGRRSWLGTHGVAGYFQPV